MLVIAGEWRELCVVWNLCGLGGGVCGARRFVLVTVADSVGRYIVRVLQEGDCGGESDAEEGACGDA